jgi:hypothetical protein
MGSAVSSIPHANLLLSTAQPRLNFWIARLAHAIGDLLTSHFDQEWIAVARDWHQPRVVAHGLGVPLHCALSIPRAVAELHELWRRADIDFSWLEIDVDADCGREFLEHYASSWCRSLVRLNARRRWRTPDRVLHAHGRAQIAFAEETVAAKSTAAENYERVQLGRRREIWHDLYHRNG